MSANKPLHQERVWTFPNYLLYMSALTERVARIGLTSASGLTLPEQDTLRQALKMIEDGPEIKNAPGFNYPGIASNRREATQVIADRIKRVMDAWERATAALQEAKQAARDAEHYAMAAGLSEDAMYECAVKGFTGADRVPRDVFDAAVAAMQVGKFDFAEMIIRHYMQKVEGTP